MTHHVDLDQLTLETGKHETREEGVCLLEAVAWWAGEPHSDHPACVSPLLGDFGRHWNDALPDDRRHILRQFVPLLPGTADGHDLARSYLALDWLTRTCAPAFMDLTPALAGHAAALRALAPLTGPAEVQAAAAAGAAARDAAWDAARDAAWAAAGDAARDAAWAAAWDAARDAAWAAAWAAAWDAAWAAAGDAARDAAWDAAWAAAWDAAWAAARDAARDAAWAAARAAAGDAAGDAAWAAARDAARAAARDALAPAVLKLQDSALALFAAMLHPEPAAATAQ